MSNIREILAQLLQQVGPAVGDSLAAHFNPQYFQQQQENRRQTSAQQFQADQRKTMTPYEAASLRIQQQAQERLSHQQAAEEAWRQGQLQLQGQQQDNATTQFLFAHPGVREVQSQLNLTPSRQPNYPYTSAPYMSPESMSGDTVTASPDMVQPVRSPIPGLNGGVASGTDNIDLSNLPELRSRMTGQISGPPPGALPFNGRLFLPPEQTMFTVPKDESDAGDEGMETSPFSGSFKPGTQIPINDQTKGMIERYFAGYQKNQALRQHKSGLVQMEKQGLKSISENISKDNPVMADILTTRLANARNQDSRQGSTSEMNQVLKDIGSFIYDKSPEALRARAEEKRSGAIFDKKDLAMFMDSLHNGPPPDDDAVAQNARMVLHNPDNIELVKMMDKRMKGAVAAKFLATGLDFNKLTNQVRESREFAEVADPLMKGLVGKIDQADKDGKIGVFTSRINSFNQGTIGHGDPQYTQLATEVDLLRKLITKIHQGTRGAASPQNTEMWMKKLDEGKMDGSTMKAVLAGYDTIIKGYLKAGIRPFDEIDKALGGAPSGSVQQQLNLTRPPISVPPPPR